MPSAKVLVAEIDRSSYAPESNGVYGYMSIPLVRGRTDKAGFSTSEEQFLATTTPDGRIEPGMHIGYYVALDFLRRSNKLWWGRAHNGASAAGLVIPAEGTSELPKPLPSGTTNPESHIFGASDLFLMYANSEGEWGKYISTRITENATEGNGAFNLHVYWKNVLQQTYVVSRDPSAKDGYSRPMYIETVMEASPYVRVVDNTAIDKSVMPKMLDAVTTSWDSVTTTTPYSDAKDEVNKQVTYGITGSNSLAGRFPASIGGASFLVPAGATAEQTADSATSADFTGNPDVDSVSSKGKNFTIDYKSTSGDVTNEHAFMPRAGVITPAEEAVASKSAVTAASATAEMTIAAPAMDTGDFTVNLGGRNYELNVASVTETTSSLANKLNDAIAADTSRLANTTVSASVVTLTAVTPGVAGNALNVGVVESLGGLSVTAPTFSGGSNAVASVGSLPFVGAATSAGVLTAGVGPKNYPISISDGDTNAAVAQALAASVNSDSTSPVIASVSAGTVSLVAKVAGAAGDSLNLAITGAVAGLTITPAAFAGGADAVSATTTITFDPVAVLPGAVTVQVNATVHAIAIAANDTLAEITGKVLTVFNSGTEVVATSAVDGTILLTTTTIGAIANTFTINVTGKWDGAVITNLSTFQGGTDAAPAISASAYVPAVTKDLIVVNDFSVGQAYDAGAGTPKSLNIRFGGNNTGSNQFLLVEDVAVAIDVADTTGEAVAGRVMAKFNQIQSNFGLVQSASVIGDIVTFNYHLTAGDARPPRVVNSAALGIESVYTSQSYQAPISGQPQIEEVHITGSPTGAGSVTVAGISTTITAADSRSQVASKVATALNDNADYSATSSGEKVVVTYVANGPQSKISYSSGTTGVGIANLTSQTGVSDIAAVPKRHRVRLSSGNDYGVDIAVNLLDVVAVVPAAADSATKVAEAISIANWNTNSDLDRVTSSGREVEVEWTASAGDALAPVFYAGVSSYGTATPAVSQSYTTGTLAVAEVQQLRISEGNTSGRSEILYVAGVPVNLTSGDTTEKSITARIKAANLPTKVPSIASVELNLVDSRVLDITYNVSAGDVDSLKIASASTFPVGLGGGTNGGAVTDTHMIKSLDLQRPLTYNLLMDAGWTTPAFQKEATSRCEKRMDCMAILSTPYEVEANSDPINAIIDYRKNRLNLDSSYAALYTGQLKITDKFNDRTIWVPVSGAIGAIASSTITKTEPWQAFAGDVYGAITWPTDVLNHFSEGEMDLLQDNQVNPILFDPGRGIKLWGQRTLQARPSATDRVNVRLLLIYVEVAMKEYLRTFLWSANVEDTRLRMRTGADSFMEGVKSRHGIYAYRNEIIATAQDIDNNQLHFNQYVEPVKSIELINFNEIIVRTGTL